MSTRYQTIVHLSQEPQVKARPCMKPIISATNAEPDMKAMPRMYVAMKLANHRPRAALLFGSAPTASQTWPIRGAMMEVLT